MLFNAFLNDFFFCIRKGSVDNFADDNTWSSFARSATLLVEILMAESNGFLYKKLELNTLLMQDTQKVKLYTFSVFFATLTKN